MQKEQSKPVLESVEPRGDALDPPLSILVCVKDKLDGCLHTELLLQSEKMLLPGTTTLGKKQDLPTGIDLKMKREAKAILSDSGCCTVIWAGCQK